MPKEDKINRLKQIWLMYKVKDDTPIITRIELNAECRKRLIEEIKNG